MHWTGEVTGGERPGQGKNSITAKVDTSASEADSPGERAIPLRDVISYLALTGCALAFLWHFANIWLYGVTQAAEPNLVIRGFETALFFVLLGLGIERMIAAVRKRGRI